jgi:drug/metabolite transporter (DMT)-like permease
VLVAGSFVVAVGLALAAAVCYATAAVLQQDEASHQDVDGLRLLARLARRRRWWLGVGATGAGAALHLVALGAGPLVVVQPLGVSALVMALLIRSWWAERPISGRAWAGAAGVMIGLPAVLAAVPAHARSAGPTSGYWATAGTILAAALIAGAAATVLRARPAHSRAAPVCFAAGAAFCFGLTSGTARTVWLGDVAPLHIAVGLAAAVAGTALAQQAYRDGGLGAPLAVLTVLDPVTAGLVGVLVLGEPFGGSPTALVAGLAGAAVATVGVALLSTDAGPPADPPMRSRTARTEHG